MIHGTAKFCVATRQLKKIATNFSCNHVKSMQDIMNILNIKINLFNLKKILFFFLIWDIYKKQQITMIDLTLLKYVHDAMTKFNA